MKTGTKVTIVILLVIALLAGGAASILFTPWLSRQFVPKTMV